jgi:hypothetical protein
MLTAFIKVERGVPHTTEGEHEQRGEEKE